MSDVGSATPLDVLRLLKHNLCDVMHLGPCLEHNHSILKVGF